VVPRGRVHVAAGNRGLGVREPAGAVSTHADGRLASRRHSLLGDASCRSRGCQLQ
jgi:hypothetical protein